MHTHFQEIVNKLFKTYTYYVCIIFLSCDDLIIFVPEKKFNKLKLQSTFTEKCSLRLNKIRYENFGMYQ